MPYKLALVDFDGTLADSMPCWLALPVQTLAEAGLPRPEGFEQEIRARPMWEIARYLGELYPQLLRSGPLEDRWLARMEDNYRRRIALRPGAAEFLRTLRSHGMQVWLLSATARPLLAPAVERFGLGPYLDRVVTEAEAGSKHSPAPYARCRQALDAAPAETLLVEDSPVNLRMGASLGLGTIAVRDESMAAWEPELRRLAGLYLTDLRDRPTLEAFLSKNA